MGKQIGRFVEWAGWQYIRVGWTEDDDWIFEASNGVVGTAVGGFIIIILLRIFIG